MTLQTRIIKSLGKQAKQAKQATPAQIKEINRRGDNIQRAIRRAEKNDIILDKIEALQSKYKEIHARTKNMTEKEYLQKKKALDKLEKEFTSAKTKEGNRAQKEFKKLQTKMKKGIDNYLKAVKGVERKHYAVGPEILQDFEKIQEYMDEISKKKTMSIVQIQKVNDILDNTIENNMAAVKQNVLDSIKANYPVLQNANGITLETLPDLDRYHTVREKLEVLHELGIDAKYQGAIDLSGGANSRYTNRYTFDDLERITAQIYEKTMRDLEGDLEDNYFNEV